MDALLKTTENRVTTRMAYNLPEGEDARFLARQAHDAARTKQAVIHVALDEVRLSTLSELLQFFAPDIEVVVFPAWDCLPYDRVSPHGDVMGDRVTALSRMLEWKADGLYKPRIILTTVNAIIQRVMPPETLTQTQLVARKNERLNEKDLKNFLSSNGYMRSDTVREAGEFAIRGSIIDLFPPGYESPVRIDLFGDEVESIRSFDPVTQITTGILDSFILRPVTEFFLDDASIARFRSGYREIFGTVGAGNPLYEAITEGRRHAGMEHWLPLFHDHMATLFDYATNPRIVFDHQADQARQERLTQIEDFYKARKTLDESLLQRKKKGGSDVSLSGTVYHPLPPERLTMFDGEFNGLINALDVATIVPFAAPDGDEKLEVKRARDFADVRMLPGANVFAELYKYMAHLQNDKRRVVIACYSQGSRDRMKVMMEEGGAGLPHPCDNWHQVTRLSKGQVGAIILHLEHGFIADDLAVITEQDILGDRLARKSGKRRKADNFLREVGALAVGDLVVHIDHGVGRFEGLETLKAGGLLHDCLKITYSGGDRLFVPVENIDLLSRFGNADGNTELDKLGGAGWQARKARVKKDLLKIAEGLLAIAANRLLRDADVLDIDHGHYNEFVSRFPYQETDDQLRAIEDTIADMKSGRPMDRLICGDVGFGKTEVALRAAYVAAMAGYQVAIIAPTTLLARQHFANFRARFAEMGLRVEQISRLVTAKDVKLTKEGLRDGSVRVVVGTHALLAADVKFANLGLVVVDEEQRFGVKQKERLKELKNAVHILTLSATPIPRTLQLALTGVRDMSLIATPPVDRLAIRTFVMPYDPLVVREAILREHYRGGQSFYVCPRIKDMEEIEQQLRELVPEVKIIAAHGQMTPTELEDRMNAFYDGQYGILLATNIIESGLDIPSANTIIIHRADMFGLSQLYQIRGRVGRSKVRAYAYLTYPPTMRLTEDAQKRLEIFETLDSLGAGFQLASHDLDIRGAGNLLGEAQSGHIKEVGIELYQQMLEDAVAMARGGGLTIKETNHEWSPTLNLGTSVLIPERYVTDLGTRMSLYRRLGELAVQDDIDGFAAEMIDRFGELPDEVTNLLEIVRIKMLCKQAGIIQFDAGPKGAIIRFHNDTPPNPEALFKWVAKNPGTVKIRPDQKITVLRSWDNVKDRVKGARSIAGDLVF